MPLFFVLSYYIFNLPLFCPQSALRKISHHQTNCFTSNYSLTYYALNLPSICPQLLFIQFFKRFLYRFIEDFSIDSFGGSNRLVPEHLCNNLHRKALI